MNYKKHRAESIDAGITPPRNQMWFSKQVTSINDPHGDIIKPDSTMMLDYEVELAFVIGKECYQVSAADAKEYIFGYTVCNDISMRDWQLHNMPERVELMIGKSHDSHGPIGPWIVTSDEIADPHKLDLKCYVNGELRQSSNTDDMIWNCYEQIEYLSSAMTLKPGDLIITGTPPGSGFSPRGASGLTDKGRKGERLPGVRRRCEVRDRVHREHREQGGLGWEESEGEHESYWPHNQYVDLTCRGVPREDRDRKCRRQRCP